ncbi:MAG: type II toxin-antitoxin system VapC family toxin [Flavobacteriales bacterium]|nr:type II toxin-antitoxin system VapC family toxin [Flavobacteriales bacterium]
MIVERTLADTNALIHQLGGDQHVGELLKDKKVHISFVTQIELLSWPGYSTEERTVVSEQIKEFIVTDVNENIKMIAIDIRIKHKLKLADALIAATAISLSIPLVTGDKHFNRLKAELDLIKI